MDSFEFESGKVLENVNVEYITRGFPKYDENGIISNAIVYCPNLRGGHSILDNSYDLIRSNFEKDDFFIIKIFPIGTPDSSSPSTTDLKLDFPSYTFKDRVNFFKQVLSEKFNINHVLGVIGEGLGGFDVFTWACEYPEDMDFIVVLNSSVKTYSYRYIFLKCVESIIESSEDYYSGIHSSSLSLLTVAVFRLLFAGYFPKNILENLSNDEIDVLMDDFIDEGFFVDLHDFKVRNDCILNYDVEDKLSNIKSESLIIGTSGYAFFDPEKDIVPLENMIKNSKIRIVGPEKENYYDEEDYDEVISEVVSFLNQFKK